MGDTGERMNFYILSPEILSPEIPPGNPPEIRKSGKSPLRYDNPVLIYVKK
jgi:hypothetical protein